MARRKQITVRYRYAPASDQPYTKRQLAQLLEKNDKGVYVFVIWHNSNVNKTVGLGDRITLYHSDDEALSFSAQELGGLPRMFNYDSDEPAILWSATEEKEGYNCCYTFYPAKRLSDEDAMARMNPLEACCAQLGLGPYQSTLAKQVFNWARQQGYLILPDGDNDG